MARLVTVSLLLFFAALPRIKTFPLCGEMLTGESGIITSPGYPYSYPTNISCYIHIRVPPMCRAALAFCSFHLEKVDKCSYDFLKVFESNTTDSSKRRLGKYCGGNTPPTVVSSTNELLLHFVSDDTTTFSGFYAQYRAECATTDQITTDLQCVRTAPAECHNNLPTDPTGVTASPTAEFHSCGQNLTGKSGIVTSPGFPSDYPNELNCLIRIQVPFGCQAKLAFCSFDLEEDPDPNVSECVDYLEVTGEETADNKESGKFCGTVIPPVLVSSTNEFSLRFWTDFSGTWSGFKAYYSAECSTTERPTLGIDYTEAHTTGIGRDTTTQAPTTEHFATVRPTTEHATSKARLTGITTEAMFTERSSTDYLTTDRITTETPTASSCGKSCSVNKSVARGSTTYPGEFPWQAMLCSSLRGYLCSGVVVGCSYIITAAHCVFKDGALVRNLTVCVGRHCGNCSQDDSQGRSQCYKPLLVTPHHEYDPVTLNHDIAVIKLRKSVLCSCNSAIPVCLPNRTENQSYITIRPLMPALLTGWGNDRIISRSGCLRKSDVRLITPYHGCELSYLTYRADGNSTDGSCVGDTGGPLVFKSTGTDEEARYFLVGIVSWPWEKGCGTVRETGVYTSVLSHLDWVNQLCTN